MATQACVFCEVVNQKEPAFIVFEDDQSVAFLDKKPLFPGHTLLVPRRHICTLEEIEAPLLTQLVLNVQMLSEAVERAMEAEGTFIALNNKVSQSVPHVHFHIVPRRKHDGLKGFFWPRHPYVNEDDARAVQEAVIRCLRDPLDLH